MLLLLTIVFSCNKSLDKEKKIDCLKSHFKTPSGKAERNCSLCMDTQRNHTLTKREREWKIALFCFSSLVSFSHDAIFILAFKKYEDNVGHVLSFVKMMHFFSSHCY